MSDDVKIPKTARLIHRETVVVSIFSVVDGDEEVDAIRVEAKVPRLDQFGEALPEIQAKRAEIARKIKRGEV